VSVTGGEEAVDSLGKTLVYESPGQFLLGFAVPEMARDVLRDIQYCLENGRSRTATYPEAGRPALKVFIEVIVPATHLVVYGGNYDIHSLLRMAGELGWTSTLVVNLHKAGKSLVSLATRVLDYQSETIPAIDPYTAVLLMSHDYKTDFANLQRVIKTPTPYIGLLGPRKRSVKMFETLEQEGRPLAEQELQRIFSPAGLDIGASTPEEIALSILAEIKSRFADRQGMPLRERQGTIYGD
jgi:xanthine/CO dehydrogenase XdhC/CoxF family maturation factor